MRRPLMGDGERLTGGEGKYMAWFGLCVCHSTSIRRSFALAYAPYGAEVLEHTESYVAAKYLE